jgi:hypothetical protein
MLLFETGPVSGRDMCNNMPCLLDGQQQEQQQQQQQQSSGLNLCNRAAATYLSSL